MQKGCGDTRSDFFRLSLSLSLSKQVFQDVGRDILQKTHRDHTHASFPWRARADAILHEPMRNNVKNGFANLLHVLYACLGAHNRAL